MTRAELTELARLLKELGVGIEPDGEASTDHANVTDENSVRDLYLPKAPRNFYYDPKVFRKLLGIR